MVKVREGDLKKGSRSMCELALVDLTGWPQRLRVESTYQVKDRPWEKERRQETQGHVQDPRSRGTVFLVEAQSWMANWPHCGSLWRELLAYRPHQVTFPHPTQPPLWMQQGRTWADGSPVIGPSPTVLPKCKILIIVQLVVESATENSYRVKPWGSRARSSKGDQDPQMTVMELTHFTSLTLGSFTVNWGDPPRLQEVFQKALNSICLWFCDSMFMEQNLLRVPTFSFCPEKFLAIAQVKQREPEYTWND